MCYQEGFSVISITCVDKVFISEKSEVAYTTSYNGIAKRYMNTTTIWMIYTSTIMTLPGARFNMEPVDTICTILIYPIIVFVNN